MLIRIPNKMKKITILQTKFPRQIIKTDLKKIIWIPSDFSFQKISTCMDLDPNWGPYYIYCRPFTVLRMKSEVPLWPIVYTYRTLFFSFPLCLWFFYAVMDKIFSVTRSRYKIILIIIIVLIPGSSLSVLDEAGAPEYGLATCAP